jgi:hypothetical protein
LGTKALNPASTVNCRRIHVIAEKKVMMNRGEQLLYPFSQPSERIMTRFDPKVHLNDKRVARLLLVLHEIDQSVAGLEELPQTELSELVSSAIMACGFADGTEARYAISAVLDAIERRVPMSESS